MVQNTQSCKNRYISAKIDSIVGRKITNSWKRDIMILNVNFVRGKVVGEIGLESLTNIDGRNAVNRQEGLNRKTFSLLLSSPLTRPRIHVMASNTATISQRAKSLENDEKCWEFSLFPVIAHESNNSREEMGIGRRERDISSIREIVSLPSHSIS